MNLKTWINSNFLRLNSNKSEGILTIHTKKMRHYSLSIQGFIISNSAHIQNLGVTLDSKFSYQSHIKNITKTAFFHLWDISGLDPPFPPLQHIHSFVTTRLDYCNAVFYRLLLRVLTSYSMCITQLLELSPTQDHEDTLHPHSKHYIVSLFSFIYSTRYFFWYLSSFGLLI